MVRLATLKIDFMTSPAELWATYAELFCAGKAAEWRALWQDDGQFIVAYPFGGMPETTTGSADIAKGVKMLGQLMKKVEISDINVIETTDPNLFIAEYVLELRGRRADPYRSKIMSKVTLRDGKIASVVEYFDSLEYRDFLKTMGI